MSGDVIKNESLGEHGFSVLLPGNICTAIKHLTASEAQETLGIWFCPVGLIYAELEMLQAGLQGEWISRTHEENLIRGTSGSC